MIRVNNIYKSFDSQLVLKDVSAEFKPGECSLVIGASGSGKTVFLKTLVGLEEIDGGEIWYENELFSNLAPKKRNVRMKELGMLFQEGALFDFATALENVMFPLTFQTRMSESERIQRARFCLDRVGLSSAEKKYPSELSGGMQKRVGLARAIALNPKYLFCDEPNSGLDPQTSIVIDNLIADLTREYNIITVINTHDMNSVIEIGDNISFMYKGEILWRGNNKEILSSQCEELNNFVFASNLAKHLRPKNNDE